MLPLLRRPALAGLLAGLSAGLALEASAGQAPVAAPPQGAPNVIEIDHHPPACVAAGKYARLDACFRPSSQLARARIYFRAFGTKDWFYVEMARDMPCHHALLPRPKKDIGKIEYYISATDRRSSEARTKDETVLVTADGRCSGGPLAPYADSGSVVIGSATGAAPVGFVTGGGISPLVIAGGAAVVVGGGAALLIHGSDNSTTTTTTTTTTTSTTATTSSTTTTTTTLPPAPTTTTTTTKPCETPNQKPVVTITSPPTGPVGNPVAVVAAASDPQPGSGVKEVRFTYQYCPGGACGAEVAIGTTTSGPPYTVTWANQPSCGTAPEDRFRLLAVAVDNCGNISDVSFVDVRSVGRGCFRFAATPGPSGSWQSDLQIDGARGQVVVDGADAVFPSAGTQSFTGSLGPGPHRFEATLVDGGGGGGRRGGAWRFDLGTLRVQAGSLRVVAGDVEQVAADAVVFRLRGRAGERVVFAFEVAAR
jgi:hypothetical protein